MSTKALQLGQSRPPSSAVRKAAIAYLRPDIWGVQLELRVDGKHFATKGWEYLIEPMRDRSAEIDIKKAAQMGFTVTAIMRALHSVVERKWNGLYLLPFKQGAVTFVQGRVDSIIDSSPELKSHFSRVENRSHKQTVEKVNLYFRGTNIATELREIPVDFEIWDERDKFVEKYLDDALARMDGSKVGKLLQLSTPTGPGVGIDSEDNWRSSDQHEWEIPCSHCGRFQVLTFEDNVCLGDDWQDSVIECSYCHKKITDRQRWEANSEGRWVPQYLDGRKRGYHISQLNSPVKRFSKLIKQYYDGQSDSVKLRGFYTLGLGQPYAGSGDKFTEYILDSCIMSGLTLRTVPNGPLFVGVDVGSRLHCKVSYEHRGQRILWDTKIFPSFEKLEEFLHTLHNFNCVIDAFPEKSKAKELANKFKGRVWLGYEKNNPVQSEVAVFNEREYTVNIDRTMAFDQLLSDHAKGLYAYPMNARELGEDMPKKDYNGYYAHHLEMVRIPVDTPKGTTEYRWAKTRNPDHWHHTDMFELVAFQKRPPLTVPANISMAFKEMGGLVRS